MVRQRIGRGLMVWLIVVGLAALILVAPGNTTLQSNLGAGTCIASSLKQQAGCCTAEMKAARIACEFATPLDSFNPGNCGSGYGEENRGLFLGKLHAGIDSCVAEGSTVRAIAAGEVDAVYNGANWPGAVIVIRHTMPDNSIFYSFYGHVTSNSGLEKGQPVNVNDSIATVIYQEYDGKPNSHLHFEVRNFPGQAHPNGLNGYTPSLSIHPDSLGYRNPVTFLASQPCSVHSTKPGDSGSGSNPSQPSQPGDSGSGSSPSQPGNSGFDNSKFINDLNYFDGTPVETGHTFLKGWQLYNNGETTWGEGYTAVRTSGSYGPASFKIPATAPGKLADIGASFTAPSTLGLSRATYYLRNPSGQTFGEPFWVELDVQDSGSLNKIIAPETGTFKILFNSVNSGCTGNFGFYSPINQVIFKNYKYKKGGTYYLPLLFLAGEPAIFYLQPLDFCTGPTHLSTNPKQAIITHPSKYTWKIWWEDMPYAKADRDYNDLVARVDFTPLGGPIVSSPVAGSGFVQAQPTVVAQTPKPSSRSFLMDLFNLVKELFRPRAPSPAPMKQAASTSPQIVGYFDHSKLYMQTGTVYTSTLGVYTSTLNYLGHQSKPKASGSTYGDLTDSSSPYALTANGNDGTDFLLKTGDSIVAGVEGVITATGQISTYCTLTKHYTFTNFVKVQHASGSTLEYQNLGKIKDSLPIGTKVLTDTILGYAGPTNCTKEPIFHFVIRSAKGLALDPFGWQPSADSVWQNIPDPSQPFELAQSFITKRKPLWVTPAEAVAILETTGTTVITSTSKRILVSAPSTVYSNRPLRLELVENPMPASVPGEETKLSFSLQGYGAWDQLVKQLNGLVTLDVTVPASQAANPAVQKLASYKRGEGQFAALQGSLQAAGSTWAIQRWDETKGSWQPLYTTYDAKTGHAQAQTYQLGTFTLGTTSSMPSAAPKLPTNTPTRTPIAPELTATAGGATLTPEIGNVTPSVPELTATAGGETFTPVPTSVPSPALTNTPNVPEITATAGGATLTPSLANTPNIPELTATAGGATLTPVSTNVPNAPEQTATVSGKTLTPSPTNTPNVPELTATAGGPTLTPSATNTPNAPELTATAGGPTLTPSATPTGTPSVAGKGKEVFLPFVKR